MVKITVILFLFSVFTSYANDQSPRTDSCQFIFENTIDIRKVVHEVSLVEQMQDSLILKQVDKRATVNTFLSTYFIDTGTRKYNIDQAFVEKYIYDTDFREWMLAIQTFYLYKDDEQVSKEGLSQLREFLQAEAKEKQFSIKFFETYEKRSSFRKLVDDLRSFIRDIPDIQEQAHELFKHPRSHKELLREAKQSIIADILSRQRIRDSEVFKRDVDRHAVIFEFMERQQKPKYVFWYEFLYMYANDPIFRDWFRRMKLNMEMKKIKELFPLSAEDIRNEQTIRVEAKKFILWERVLKAYYGDLHFQKWVFDFQSYLFEYKLK